MTDPSDRNRPFPSIPVDFDERAATISMAVANFKSGEFGEIRAKSLLVLCGLNATEIEELLAPLRIKG